MTDAGTIAAQIERKLAEIGPIVVACSGGIDSTLLALVAHRAQAATVTVAHAVSPAVPEEGTARVKLWAEREGWDLRIVTSGEFADEAYLSNPVNRCYFCKSNLYSSLEQIRASFPGAATIVSGANLDDLGEYRPGLIAAGERGVRHPWIEADLGKADIRLLARSLDLDFADLPASPCLASRLYTGTRVTAPRLRAIHACENRVKDLTGLAIVRCRIRGHEMIVEVPDADRQRIDAPVLADLVELARGIEPEVQAVVLDDQAYRPGRAFVGAP